MIPMRHGGRGTTADVLGSDLGKAVVTNTATQILFWHGSQQSMRSATFLTPATFGRRTRAAHHDENSVMFSRHQQHEFEQLCDALQAAMGAPVGAV